MRKKAAGLLTRAGGNMGEAIRSRDWSDTTLGPLEDWSPVFITLLNTLLASRFPMLLLWGGELNCFHNDAYQPTFRHNGLPRMILGEPVEKAFAETWSFIGGMIRRVLENNESLWYEDQPIPVFRNNQPAYVYWTYSYSPVLDDQGNVAGIMIIGTDTTEKVNILKDLQTSRDELHFAIDAAELGTFDYNPQTNRFSANARLKEWFGLPAHSEMDLSRAIAAIASEDRERVGNAIRQSLDYSSGGRYDTVYTIRHPITRRETIVHAKGKATFDTDRQATRLNGTLQDVTERTQADKELARTTNRLQLALQAGALGSYEVELATGKMTCTEQCRINFGLPADSRLSYGELIAMVVPEDRAPMRVAMQESLNSKSVYNAQYRILWPDGSIHWIQTSAIPLYDESGMAYLMNGVTADITERKHFEDALENLVAERTRELHEKNEDLEKINQELEAFTYITSHDLQEPLRKIQILSSTVSEKEFEHLTPSGRNYLNRMQASAKRMQVLIEDLLVYSRTSDKNRHFEITDLNASVAEVLTELEEKTGQLHAELRVARMPSVPAISFQMRQLFQNLIGNALKFVVPGRKPVISVSAVISRPEAGQPGPLGGTEAFCHIVVSDNGIGFNPEYADRIFDVFKRLNTTAEFEGTGIGLSIVKKIVENHQGRITASGMPDNGARFDIYLPAER